MAVVIWRFTDARAGHRAQSRGLIEALGERVPVQSHDIPVARDGVRRLLDAWLRKRYPAGDDLPAPDLLIGAGHATHAHLLAARHARGGRSIVLMKPSLPCTWFDLCLVPEHDHACAAGNIIATQGVLNPMRARQTPTGDTGLILIGGPSRHVRWDDADILRQLDALLASRPERQWRVATSPRTPAALVDALRARTDLCLQPFESAPAHWLGEQLAAAGEVWVSEDSVSMVYEALSAGVRVGLLKVTRARRNRLSRGIDTLVARGWVSAPGDWRLAAGPPRPLDEAARCANWITRQWLSVV